MGKVNNWELYKRLKFNHSIKWYMHKPESILENETHEILWGFKIQIPTRKSDQVSKRKELLIPADYS